MAFDYQGAKAAGYSDEEIQSYLASKQPQKTTMQKVADFIAPASQKFGKAVTGAFTFGAESKAQQSLQQQLQIRQQSLIDQANRETDPMKKQELLRMARETVGQGKTDIGQRATQLQSEVGMKEGQSNLGYALKTGLGVGAEVGSWVAPTSLQVTKAAPVISGAKGRVAMSAISGGLSALSDNEKQDLMSTVKGAVTSAFVTGGAEAMGKGIQKAWRAITKSAPKAVMMRSLGVKNDREMNAALKTLESGKAGSFGKMKEYAKKIGEDAETNLRGVDLPQGLTPQQLFGTEDFGKIQTAMQETKDLADELIKKREYKLAQEVNVAMDKLNTNQPITLQEGLQLKRAFQIGYNEKLTEAGAAKRVARQNISNDMVRGIRGAGEDNGFPIIGQLLDIEQQSLLLKKMVESQSVQSLKDKLPSLLELSAIMGSMYAMSETGSPIAGIAGGAFVLNRALRDPKFAASLFGAGKATDKIGGAVGKVASTKSGKAVSKFFQRGVSRELGKEGANL